MATHLPVLRFRERLSVTYGKYGEHKEKLKDFLRTYETTEADYRRHRVHDRKKYRAQMVRGEGNAAECTRWRMHALS